MIRMIGGIAVGLAVAIFAGLGVALLGDLLYPVPTELRARAAVEAFRGAPLPVKLFLLATVLAAALAGGAAGKRVSRRAAANWIVAAAVAAFAVAIMFVAPLPAWMMVGLIVAALLGAILANHLVPGETARPAGSEHADA